MYVNYGDRNFFERGVLIKDPECAVSEYEMLLCRPYSDHEDLYQFSRVVVDINADWIDRKAVINYAGMPIFDPLWFAISCTEYYSWEEFGAGGSLCDYDWKRMTKADVLKELSYYFISAYDMEPLFERNCPFCGRPMSLKLSSHRDEENLFHCEACEMDVHETEGSVFTSGIWVDTSDSLENSILLSVSPERNNPACGIPIILCKEVSFTHPVFQTDLWIVLLKAADMLKDLAAKHSWSVIKQDAVDELKARGLVV